jgi:hypothetical protein
MAIETIASDAAARAAERAVADVVAATPKAGGNLPGAFAALRERALAAYRAAFQETYDATFAAHFDRLLRP